MANNGTGSSSVTMLDADTLQTLAERVVGMHVDVEVDSAAGLVYVSLFGAAKIMILSADDLSIKGEVVDPVRMRRPHGLAVFPDVGGDAMIYVARTVRGIPRASPRSRRSPRSAGRRAGCTRWCARSTSARSSPNRSTSPSTRRTS